MFYIIVEITLLEEKYTDKWANPFLKIHFLKEIFSNQKSIGRNNGNSQLLSFGLELAKC